MKVPVFKLNKLLLLNLPGGVLIQLIIASYPFFDMESKIMGYMRTIHSDASE